MTVEDRYQNKRVFGLDLMRASAILIVLLVHGSNLFGNYFANPTHPVFIDGVDLFFVLSGFLIGRILIIQLQQKRTDMAGLFSFWTKRWFRTLPLYYLILLVNIFASFIRLTDAKLESFSWKFFFFLQNFNWYFQGFFVESWSLAVEEWFYLLFPITLFALTTVFKPGHSFFIAVAFFLLASLCYRVYAAGQVHNYFQWDLKLRKIVLARFDGIMWGTVIAWFHVNSPSVIKKYRFKLFILGMCFLLLIYLVPGFPTGFFHTMILLTAQPFAIALLLPAIYYLDCPYKIPAVITNFISTSSYSMYLLHAIVLRTIIYHFPVRGFNDGWLKFCVYLSLTAVLSYLTYQRFEKPVMSMRSRVLVTNSSLKQAGNFTSWPPPFFVQIFS